MLNVLVNAYAVSPNWGSESGMGWNWIVNLAKYCHLEVITEGEWHNEIEEALQNLPQAANITFHYLPVSDKIRRMCWNQGDWRFYWYYRKWQKRALARAREICDSMRIDIIHQLNMIGFREPGYLWRIPGIPFVWGPVGGMELMPIEYLQGVPVKQALFNRIKNMLNRLQYTFSPRVRKAISASSCIISAVKGVQDVIQTVYHRESILINETGVDVAPMSYRSDRPASAPLKIIWVGKFDFRKQLPLALKAVIAMGRRNVELHICGTGPTSTIKEMHEIAEAGGIADLCYWHGKIANAEVKKLLLESDLMLFTSIMEATSTVVLEAISAGLPVVCFNTCGFGPIVKSFAGVTVELSDPAQSVQDFATILNNLYDDRELLHRISDNILQNRTSLTWDAKAQRTLEIYNSILK